MNNKIIKKTILIDLDGILNTYSGDFNKDVIPPIKIGAKEFLANLSEKFCIKIFTTRNKILTAKWLISNNIEQYIDDITNVKELCYLFIDDRCINFNGNFDELAQNIENFKPWFKNFD